MSDPDETSEKKRAAREKILADIERERDEKDTMQRFGYFTIPYPAIVGDEAYSRAADYKHKVVDHKVITEKRGIYTTPGKKGKTPDVYFDKDQGLTKEELDQIIERKKQEDEKYSEIVQQRKEKKAGIVFKPPGPQEVLGFYSGDPQPVPDGPLVREKDKLRFKQDRAVITERRGLYTNPTKVGDLPSEYFSYPSLDGRALELIKEKEEKEKKKREEEKAKQKVYKKPFAPASLMKCDCFASDADTYGIDNDVFKQRLEEFREYKKNGKPKYVKTNPKGSAEHPKPFAPAKLVSTGRDALFNDDLYTLPPPKEEEKSQIPIREQREMENKNRRVPFTYNKLMKNSNFSPAISSFSCNLKREFPHITFH